MNKYFSIIFALFAVVNLVRCIGTDELLENIRSKRLQQLLQIRNFLGGSFENYDRQCPGFSEKLKSALASFVKHDDKFDDSLTNCEAIQIYTLNYTAPFLKAVEDCVPAEAKGLPTLGMKSLLSAADFLCKQSGESILELGNPCLIEHDRQISDVDDCDLKMRTFGLKYENKFPNKREVCTYAIDFKTCIPTRLNKYCKNQKTRNVVVSLYDAIIVPCSHVNEP